MIRVAGMAVRSLKVLARGEGRTSPSTADLDFLSERILSAT